MSFGFGIFTISCYKPLYTTASLVSKETGKCPKTSCAIYICPPTVQHGPHQAEQYPGRGYIHKNIISHK